MTAASHPFNQGSRAVPGGAARWPWPGDGGGRSVGAWSRVALACVGAVGAGCVEPEVAGDTGGCDPSGGVLCTWVGVPQTAMLSVDGLDRLESELYLPVDGTWAPDGQLYLIDFNNHRLRVVRADGTVHTVAGTGFLGEGPEGPALEAAFNHPTNLAFHPDDPSQLYVAAWHNSRVAVIDLEVGTVRFAYGTGGRGFGGDGGPASLATFDLPSTVAFDDAGNLYVFDQGNQVIRRIDPDGVVTTIAGKVETRQFDRDDDPETPPDYEWTRGWPGYEGDGGPALEARFHSTMGAAADPSSRLAFHGGYLYLVDTSNHVVRRIDLAAGRVEHVAGFVELVPAEGNVVTYAAQRNEGYGFEDGPVASARFNYPRDLDVAADGTIYVADTDNHCVRRIRDGMVDTVAGVCGEPGFDGDGLPATVSRLWTPFGVALSPDDTRLMVADTQNQVFRMVSL